MEKKTSLNVQCKYKKLIAYSISIKPEKGILKVFCITWYCDLNSLKHKNSLTGLTTSLTDAQIDALKLTLNVFPNIMEVLLCDPKI